MCVCALVCVCVCVCVCPCAAFLSSPSPFLLVFCPSVVGRTNTLGAELPWRCSQPSQRPNRGINLIGSVVLHHTPTNAHIFTLACRPAWTSSLRQMHGHTHKHTLLQIHTDACLHTFSDWLFFPYLMLQPMVYFHSWARELSPEHLQGENSFRWSGSDRDASIHHRRFRLRTTTEP